MHRRLLPILALLLLLSLIGGWFCLNPRGLSIDCQCDWTEIKIIGAEPGQSRVFLPGDKLQMPMSYGVWDIDVTLRDGSHLKARYFHFDAGVRRHLDLSIAPTKTGHIHWRLRYNRLMKLFNDEVSPSTIPTLAWI